jgi:hypothetical protein
MSARKPNAILSPEQSAELDKKLGFDLEPPKSGSLAPMDANSKKWSKGLSSNALSQLAEIRAQIESTVDETILTVARARLRMGKLLNEARDLFKGDQEFGKWRKSVLPDLATRTASSYMAMAREFSDAPKLVESIGWAQARQLINAPAEVKEQVAMKAQSGDKVSSEEIKEIKKANLSPHSGAASSSKAADTTPPPGQVMSSAQRKESLDLKINRVLQYSLAKRMELVLDGEFHNIDEYSQSAIIFGFSPGIAEHKANMNVWLCVYDFLVAEAGDNEDTKRVLEQAYSKIKEAWSV